MSKSRGFTLIELLVVIAIIGILASVVLASLNTARGKAANAAVKAELSSLRAQAELQYDTDGGTYANVQTNGKIQAMLVQAAATGGNSCVINSAANTYQASCGLKVAEGSNIWWCVDSTGLAKGETSAVLSSATVCP